MVAGWEGEERWFCGESVVSEMREEREVGALLGWLSEPGFIRKPPREMDSGSVTGCGERTPTSRLAEREGLGYCRFQPEAAGGTLWNAVMVRL